MDASIQHSAAYLATKFNECAKQGVYSAFLFISLMRGCKPRYRGTHVAGIVIALTTTVFDINVILL